MLFLKNRNLVKFFNGWPKKLQLWFAAALLVLFLIGFVRAMGAKNKFINAIDGTSEIISMFAAEHYVDEGFFKNYLLPTYPPFATDLHGNPRTQPFVYNHYLAGQDLLLGVWVKIFGKNAYNFARLMPLLLTVFAVGFFSLVIGWCYQQPLLSCLLATLLLVPRSLVIWAICLFGHSYATAFVIISLSLFFYFDKKVGSKFKWAWNKSFFQVSASFIFCGLAVIFFGVDWVPLAWISLLALSVLRQRQSDPFTHVVLLSFFLGSCLGLAYQITLSSFYFGSLHAAVGDMMQWIGLRAEADFLVGNAKFGDSYVKHSHNFVFREFNKQAYGATGFTGVNLLLLTFVFLILGYSAKALKKINFYHGIFSILLVYGAAASWHILMKTHAMGNLHFVLRHYFILYLFFITISLPICFQVVERARR